MVGMPFSDRAQGLTASMTFAISAKAAEMRRQGIDVINMSTGEPDFPTPPHVVEAAMAYLREGQVKYTPVAGLPELREAVARNFARGLSLDLGSDQVIVTGGAKHALYLALQVLCNPGDEVVFARPYWLSYPEMVRLASARPVTVPTRAEDGFALDPAAVAAAITPRTRVLILNSPANPTGSILPRDNLERLAELALRHDLWLLSDEIYSELTYDEPRPASLLSLGPEVRARAIVVNGVSKTYAMTGWRIGYAAGPTEVVGLMARLQSHETANPNTLAQVATLAALTGDQAVVEERRRIFDERRRLAHIAVAAIPGWICPEPQGAFYLFPKIAALFGRSSGDRRLTSSMDLAQALLEAAHVATVPGHVFGDDQHLRLSYATSAANIEEGTHRLLTFSETLG
jgi:aspartate aminotransferase